MSKELQQLYMKIQNCSHVQKLNPNDANTANGKRSH